MTDFAATAVDGPPVSGDDGIVIEAVDRWHACKDWQGVQDERIREDIKFANADPRNAQQWPTKIYQQLTGGEDNMACLTINKTRGHNDLIINQLSKNNYGVKIRPTGGKATYESAKVMNSIIKRIEDISRFGSVRRKIAEQQVDGGLSYCIIETAYTSNRTRNQDIYLKASRDPTGVYLDPWIRQTDGSDANFGFIFERMPRKEFNRKYPKWKDKIGAAPLDSAFVNWITDKEIILAKYFRKKQTPDKYVWYKPADGADAVEKLASEIRNESGKEIYDALMLDIKNGVIEGGSRSVFNDEVEWFLIAGDTIIDRGDWAGKYIPICRCVGREVVVDATLDIKGHTRPLVDAQRMLNYNASMSVEIVALQPKSPFIAPSETIEGQEQYKTININGFPVILYNQYDDDGNKLDAPQRLNPPTPSEAHEKGQQTAERQMMMISGQWQQTTGQQDQAFPQSGRALQEGQQQGETATYHFAEHQSDMLRFIGVQLLDLIPKIYDTERTLHIMDEKNEKRWIKIDPNQVNAVQKLADVKEDEEAIQLAFNPSVGEYECVSDPGPDFATQRQEARSALGAILANNKELGGVVGDLLFKYMDVPGAEEVRERLEREIKATKPYLFGDAPDPQITVLQQQIAQLTKLNGELVGKLADAKLTSRGKDELRDIESFKAETGRMEATIRALKDLLLTPQQRAQMDHELEVMGHQHIFNSIEQVNDAALQPSAQPSGPTNGSGA
jgi:Phage P22-like portal protein